MDPPACDAGRTHTAGTGGRRIHDGPRFAATGRSGG